MGSDRRIGRRLVPVLLLALGVLLAPLRAGAQPAAAVDLALVLVVDGSASISGNVLEFQLQGHAAAFRDPNVAAAVTAGPAGAVAVTLARFSDPNRLDVLIPWTTLSEATDVAAFADAIDAVPRTPDIGATAIGSALRDALALFEAGGFDGTTRRVIDLTSNGFSNAGPDPALARDQAEQAGVTINAIAILNDYDWLEFYFRQNVIGGIGAFVRSATDQESFRDALVQKLLDEMVLLPGAAVPSGRAG